MENVSKCILCFCAQLLALYAYWHCFFGHGDFSISSSGYTKSATQQSSTNLAALQITCPSENVARTLSYGLVEKKLAACVNIVPKVSSIYHWNGSIQEDSEVLMIVKTKQIYVSQVIQFVEQGHPYDIPEVISFSIQDGNKDYLNWVAAYVDSS